MPMANPPASSSSSPHPSRLSDGGGGDPQSIPAKKELTLIESQYSRKAQSMIMLASDLTALGGEHYKLDIPGVAFIGKQSAGKSSVVERATGIPVPRDSGTCTSRGGKVKSSPVSISFRKVSKAQDVELWLQRAQAAILNYPEHKPEEFYDMTGAELKVFRHLSSFSLNTIELLVRDPEGTNLCFVDLPGIIQHHTEDPSLIQLVKSIVEHHIKKKNTIIVVTVPMTDEIENQEAFGIASKADPEGTRTIGVGTKPDLVGAGNIAALKTWQGILDGTSSNLKLGYFGVKLPDDVTRQKGLSRAELAKQEETFFASTEPWMSISDSSCLGMQNFLQRTSDLLVSLIEKNIPIMKDTVQRLLDKDTQQLHALPPIPTFETPYPSITISLFRFCKVLEATIHGDLNNDFVHRNQERYDQFKAEIVKTTPDFRNGTSSGTIGPIPGPIYTNQVQDIIRKHKTWELPGYVLFDATKELLLMHIKLWKQPLIDCFEDICRSTGALINSVIEEDEHFGRLTYLQSFVKAVVAEQGVHFQAEASTMLNKIFELENTAPIYTANEALYTQARTKWMNSTGSGYPQSDAHKVMADVHAYFHVAHMRFIDYVILCIEGEWHQKLVSSLGAKLIESLPVDSAEKMEAMLREDPAIAAKRDRLTKRVDQLTKIKTRLADYEGEARATSGFDFTDFFARARN